MATMAENHMAICVLSPDHRAAKAELPPIAAIAFEQ